MICVHVKTSTGKWITRFVPSAFGENLNENLIKNLRQMKNWEVKIGYNLLRELV